MSTVTETYNTTYNPDITDSKSTWMSEIPDDRSIADLSIPGTHGSIVYYGGDRFQCQTFSLKKQFEAGIRFLDVSCKLENDKLYIYQWNCYQKANMADVLLDVLYFLNVNNTECIILRISRDDNQDDRFEIWNTQLNYHIKAFGEHNFWLKNELPNMKDVRGKTVILNNFSETGVGIRCHNVDLIQNEHVPTIFHINSLWENAKSHLQSVKKNSGKLFVTYCCGSSWFAYPYSVAININRELMTFLEYRDLNSWGIIVLDYPGLELLEEIINSNR